MAGNDFAKTIETLDGIIGVAQSVRRNRSVGESIDMAVAMIDVIKKSGETSIEGIVSSLNAFKSLAERLLPSQE